MASFTVMKRIMWAAALIMLGCVSEQDSVNIPAEVMPLDSLAKVMVQQHLLEAKVLTSGYHADSATAYYHWLQDSLHEKMGTDSGRVNTSFRFYTQYPHLIDRLYAQVVDSLAVNESRMRND